MPSRDEQQAALEAADQVRADTYDLLAQLGSVITAVLHEVYGYPLQTAVYAGQAYCDYAKGAEAAQTDLAKKINPLVARHARGTMSSPVTRQYLTTRRWKKIGGSVVQAVGNLSSLSPTNLHVNVPGAAYHGQATLSTVAHMVAIEALVLDHGPDEDLREWIAVVRVAKATKLAIRGGQLLGAVIPAASLPTSVVAAAAKAGVKMTYAGACFAAAAKLHFHAYLERHANMDGWVEPGTAATTDRAVPSSARLSRDRSGAARPGPATNFSRPFPLPPRSGVPLAPRARRPAAADSAVRLVREIFTRRGTTRFLGAYDVDALIDEPAGWLAIADKLMLI